MPTPLQDTVSALGEGTTLTTASGARLFKLDSYPGNPIITPQDLGLTWFDGAARQTGAVFNGGAELHEGGVVLIPRCQQRYRRLPYFDQRLGVERLTFEDYLSEAWPLVSDDGVHFERIDDAVIDGDGTDHEHFTYGIEDLRIVRHDGSFLLVGTGKLEPPHNGSRDGDRIAIYTTHDFRSVDYRGIVRGFDTRNAVPFGEPVGGRYYALIRFYPDIHIDVLDAGIDQLLDPGRHAGAWEAIYRRRGDTLLLEAGSYEHEQEKIGPGTQLIATERGWLLIYHSVGAMREELCAAYGGAHPIARGYSICAALLDGDDPRRVLRRTSEPIYIPSAPYELDGDDQYDVDVPAVVFPVGAFVQDGKLLIYAGAGDKYTVLLSCALDGLVDYLWEHGGLQR